MALTSNSDFYVAVHDAGINRVIKHVMRQRPSLFNYGTSTLLSNSELLCKEIDVAPEVISAGNPIIKVLPPLPVLSTSLGLNFCVQATKGEIDFHPGNVFSLPPELNPLASQRFAVHFQACAGIGCPPRELSIPRTPSYRLSGASSAKDIPGILTQPPRDLTVVPTTKLECFCLDLFATGGIKVSGPTGYQKMLMGVDRIEIVDLKPEGLENSLECYALLALNQGILPVIGDTISNVAFDFINLPDSLGNLRVSASTTVPNNPAIEDDQLKAFINLDHIDLNITVPPTVCSGSGGGGGGGGGGSTITRTTKSRTRTGIFDLTAAISEKSFAKIFDAVEKGFSFSCSDGGSWGPFSANYAIAAHLEGGSVELQNNGTIKVSELDVKWDTLSLNICFDIPEICVGGFCIIPNPFDGCLVRAPTFCLFGGSPDFCIPLNLSGLLTSEITFTAGIQVFYGVSSGVPNRWQIVIVPTLPFDLDIIDIADTVGDLVENLIDAAIDTLLGGFPNWVKDLFKAVLGPIDDILRVVLDIPDDVGEWLLDFLSGLGIFDLLLGALNGFLTGLIPPLEVEDPYPVLPASGGLIPVKIPIEYLGVRIDSDEMVIEGDIGN